MSKPKEYDSFSAGQKFCAEMFCEWAKGWHHLPAIRQFGSGICVNWGRDLSTYDFNALTTLVLLAHRYAIRVEIKSSGPRMVKIVAHRRRPKPVSREEQNCCEDHPTLKDLSRIITAMEEGGAK